jgi:hypothetical protein
MASQATATPVLAVGTDVLGMTFNPFNQQCAAFNFSAQSSILNIRPPSGSVNEIPAYDEATEGGGMWTDSDTSQSYYVAAGLKLISSTGGNTGTSVVSETITDFTYQLALKGGLSGIVGSCMGAGEVTWSSSQARINENYYAFLDAEIDRYTLAFDPEELDMSGGLTASVDVNFRTAASGLPQSFVSSGTHSNVAVFQKFFSKWGSHIVTGVTIGGRVRFTITINKSYVSSSTELGGYINAEYGGITGDGSATDQSGYQKYQSNRASNFYAHGGDPSDANSLGSTASDANYKAWASSVPGNEAVVAVILKGIWEVPALFANNASSQMTALQDAFVYFSLAQVAIPFYCYTTTSDSPLASGDTTDWFYTTLENSEALGAYSFQNIAFYVLPQDPHNSLNPSQRQHAGPHLSFLYNRFGQGWLLNRAGVQPSTARARERRQPALCEHDPYISLQTRCIDTRCLCPRQYIDPLLFSARRHRKRLRRTCFLRIQPTTRGSVQATVNAALRTMRRADGRPK